MRLFFMMGSLLVLAFGLSNSMLMYIYVAIDTFFKKSTHQHKFRIVSLLYLSYPTKVVLKASKLIAVMPLGMFVLNRRVFDRIVVLIVGVMCSILFLCVQTTR
jgi:sulfite exporter TauE/SafE